MALPVLPIALGAVALFFLAKQSSASSSYSQAPADGSKPPKKEAAPPGKTWKEMPPALQEQVAAALGALGVSPATGELSGNPVTADAIKMASQTAALCESQGFYEVAKELKRLVAGAVVTVPTPAEAEPMKAAAPPGLTPEQVEALVRTLTMDRDPKNIEALIMALERMPQSPQRDNFIGMAKALLLQLAAAQSTTQTMQQIDQVIKSPGIAEVRAAVQPLPPVVVPVLSPAPPPAPGPRPRASRRPLASGGSGRRGAERPARRGRRGGRARGIPRPNPCGDSCATAHVAIDEPTEDARCFRRVQTVSGGEFAHGRQAGVP